MVGFIGHAVSNFDAGYRTTSSIDPDEARLLEWCLLDSGRLHIASDEFCWTVVEVS